MSEGKQLDLGISQGGASTEYVDTKDYETFFLSTLEPKSKIVGELGIVGIRDNKFRDKAKDLVVVIADHDSEERWWLQMAASVFPNYDGTQRVYGKQGGRVYTFLDTLDVAMNGGKKGTAFSRTVNIDNLQRVADENHIIVTAVAVPSVDKKATAPNVEIVKARIEEDVKVENVGG